MRIGHRLPALAGWLLPLLFALIGCTLVETPVSTGECAALIDGKPTALHLWPTGSYFYRDDRQGGVEYAYVQLEFRPDPVASAAPLLKIKGHLNGMPDPEYIGTHRLPTGEIAGDYVDSWEIREPPAANVVSGTLKLTGAERTALTGTLRMELTDRSSYDCTLLLGRNIDKDTDD